MLFFYKALTPSGKDRCGFFLSRSHFKGVRALLAADLWPLRLFSINFSSLFAKCFKFAFVRSDKQFMPLRTWLTLLERIVLVMQSGRTLMQSLTAISAMPVQESQGTFLKGAITQLKSGRFFYEVVQQLPKNWVEEQHMKLVQCAEMGGYLQRGLQCWFDQLQLKVQIRKQVVNSFMYPALVMLLATGVLLILCFYVLPEFKTFLTSQHVAFSWILKIIFSLGEYITSFFPIVLLGGMLSCTVCRRSLNIWVVKMIPKLPKYSYFVEPLQLGLFAMNFSALLKNGVYLLESLRLSLTCLTYKPLDVENIIQDLKNGTSLSVALDGLPNFFVETLQSAELGGCLASVLNSLSQHYLQLYNRRLTQFIKWLEPVCLIMIALLIVVLILSLFMPMTQMFQNFNFE
ncbi:MAG: type II secretion system F family protein [Puniceicoccales bacterium]|jgi:type II secretory pathway component PulF|nr:type II secretion system F family protein [Puniceicoccales bacterium]